MNVNRQIAQHRSSIARLRRQAVFGGIALVALVAATVCAFVFEWHPLLRALVLLPALGMLAHCAAPYTRLRDHRRKLQELEVLASKTE